MDTSETYIKMCEKAGEIQALRKDEEWQSGDFLYGEDEYSDKEVHPVVESWWFHSKYPLYELMGGDSRRFSYSDNIWLPRQDQLQEMLGLITMPCGLIDAFYGFSCPRNTIGTNQVLQDKALYPKYSKEIKAIQYISRFTSIEQLWLAFVMKERYNKLWDGQVWHRDKGNQ